MSETNSPAPDGEQPKLADITYKFCTECQNLLYPREDRATSTLLYFCKTCKHQEGADTACAWRNQLNSVITATAGEIEDVASDPTLPRKMDIACPYCGNMETVYFQSQQRAADTGMKLFYVCLACYKSFETTSNRDPEAK
ncbi:hypothetical protein DV736_g4455, partial [Chaetothyriales sp. CBS 134916]